MLDLNLIRVFATVYEEGSVTGAAETLHLAQPTVTQALRRLRRACGEDLFVKSGRRIIPTKAADKLFAEIGHFPIAAELAIQSLSDFDPSTTVETFKIALTDLGQTIFLPTLVPEFAKVAPRATLEVVNLNLDYAVDDLIAGEIDIAVASTALQAEVKSEVIRPDTYYCVARAGRFPDGLPTIEEIATLPRIVSRGTLGHTELERLLPAPAQGSVYLPGFSAVPLIAATTELIAFVPYAVVGSWKHRWDIEAWPMKEATFTSLVRAHMRRIALTSSSSWFTKWATEVLRSIPYEPEEGNTSEFL